MYWFILILFSLSSLAAEIQSLRIKWDPNLCFDNCNQLLENRLKTIRGVALVRYNPTFGEAILYYKPGAVFEYLAVERTMQTLGLAMIAIDIKVRGTITHAERQVFLTSIGDNTRFTLYSPPALDPRRQVLQYSEFNSTLSEDARKNLLNSELRFDLVTVEGELFLPERPPLKIRIAKFKPDERP